MTHPRARISTDEQIIAAWRDLGVVTAVAGQCRTNPSRVRRVLDQAGILPTSAPLVGARRPLVLLAKVAAEYQAGDSIDVLCARYRMSPKTVRRALRLHDVPTRARGPRPRPGPLDPETLARLRRAVGVAA